MNVVCPNSFIFYNMMHPNEPAILDLKTIASAYLVTQAELEPHRKIKLDQKENTGTNVS